jgi:hypothetical protein
LFGRHLLAVELAGTLLLAALVGASAITGHHRSVTAVARKHEAALLDGRHPERGGEPSEG